MSAPLPAAFPAAVAYAVRVAVPPKRAALLALPLLAAVLLGLLARVVGLSTATERFNVVNEGLFALVLPLACLIVGDAVLGAEVRSGTFALTWLSPMPFPAIVLARWLAGWVVTTTALVPAMVAATFAAGVPAAALPLALATTAGAAAYVGLFVFVGVAARRAALWSLGIVLLGERLLGTALSGIAQLSPQWLARSVYAGLGPDADELRRAGVPAGGGALVRLALVTAVTLLLALWRIRTVRLSGGDE